jgi:hypothetical protein
MRLIKEHLKPYLDGLTRSASSDFYDVFDLLTHPNKEFYKRFLIYTEKVIYDLLREGSEIAYANLHFEGATETLVWILKEFVPLRFFHLASKKGENDKYLVTKIEEYQRILKYRYAETPSYVSGLRTNKRAKKWIEAKKGDENLLKFYQRLAIKYNYKISLTPRTIVNVQTSDLERLQTLFQSRSIGVSIKDAARRSASLLLNTELTFDKVDGIKLESGEYLFDEIENIVVLGCESKNVSKSFNLRELRKWNVSGKLKTFLVVTFSQQKDGFHKLKSRLERTQSAFHSVPQFPDLRSYTVLREEVDHLLGETKPSQSSIEFFGSPSSMLWDDFVAKTELYEGLYELRSYKLMNIYSLATTSEVKAIILDGVFNENAEYNLLNPETRVTLEELSSETIENLKASLENVLSSIVQSGWLEFLQRRITGCQIMVMGDTARHHKKLITAFNNSLKPLSGYEFLSWHEVDLSNNDKSVVAIDYRDTGKFPYSIRPNLLELENSNAEVRGYFISFLFKIKFDWCHYRYSSDLFRLLTNSTRSQHFDMDDLELLIRKQKPPFVEKTNWNIEQLYQSERPGTFLRLSFSPNRVKSFPSSELFIVRIGTNSNLFVTRAGDLLDIEHDSDLYVQPLDDIHSGFNIYDKIANKQREEKELHAIKATYSLNATDKPEHLWKNLLIRQAKEKDSDEWYHEVKSYLRANGADLVSKTTFEHHWMKVDSDTLIPRERKVFRLLCAFLNLPDTYFFIMRRLKNVEVQNSRRNSQQMNSLLSDLLNANCFHDDAISRMTILTSIKQRLLKHHALEEIGFFRDTLVDDLNTLIELLRPQIELQRLLKVESN